MPGSSSSAATAALAETTSVLELAHEEAGIAFGVTCGQSVKSCVDTVENGYCDYHLMTFIPVENGYYDYFALVPH